MTHNPQIMTNVIKRIFDFGRRYGHINRNKGICVILVVSCILAFFVIILSLLVQLIDKTP